MTLEELRSFLRKKVMDFRSPKLWDDDELNSFINAAYFEAVDRQPIFDKTSPFTEFTTVENMPGYDMPDFILNYEMVRLDGRLLKSTHRAAVRQADESGTKTGRPTHFYKDDDNQLMFYPKPDALYAVELEVIRLPMLRLVDDADVPELPERLHEPMLTWALKLAYEKQDSEVLDPNASTRFDAEFTKYFGPQRSYSTQKARHEHRARVVRPIQF